MSARGRERGYKTQRGTMTDGPRVSQCEAKSTIESGGGTVRVRRTRGLIFGIVSLSIAAPRARIEAAIRTVIAARKHVATTEQVRRLLANRSAVPAIDVRRSNARAARGAVD